MFEVQFEPYTKIPFSSPKLAMSSSFKIPSSPIIKMERPAPLMTPDPDYNLRLLVNSVLSSPVTRSCSEFASTSEEITVGFSDLSENSQSKRLRKSSTPQSTSTGSTSSGSITSKGGRKATFVQGENESNQEFKKRRNRINQQRSRSKRKNLVKDLEEEIAALREIVAEKDQIIANLQSTY